MTPTHFIRAFFFAQEHTDESIRWRDEGRTGVAERLPQFTALLRRLRPKNTSPARNEVVYEEEAPMLNLLSRLALLIPFAATRGHTLKTLSRKTECVCVCVCARIFFSLPFFSFRHRFTDSPPARMVVSSRSTNPVPVCTSNSRVSGLSFSPENVKPTLSQQWTLSLDPQRDRKHIRPAFARDFSPVFATILCECLIRVSAHTRSSFVCQYMTRIHDQV